MNSVILSNNVDFGEVCEARSGSSRQLETEASMAPSHSAKPYSSCCSSPAAAMDSQVVGEMSINVDERPARKVVRDSMCQPVPEMVLMSKYARGGVPTPATQGLASSTLDRLSESLDLSTLPWTSLLMDRPSSHSLKSLDQCSADRLKGTSGVPQKS